MRKSTRILLSLAAFVLMALGYEYFVSIWAHTQQGAIMRLDIFISYPVMIVLAVLVYYLSGYPGSKKR